MAAMWRLVGAGIAGAVAAALSVLSGQDGGGQAVTVKQDEIVPEGAESGPARAGATAARPPERWAEGFGDVLGRTLRAVGAQGTALKERVEGFYGAYRLLRALGMSDAEIAAFIAGQARARLERGLEARTPTAADMRTVLDGAQESIVRAAEDVDARLDLGGDFVRRVREAAQATRTGREDALIAVERAVATAKEQLRRLLREPGAGNPER
jgi:hypothetical protein